MTRSTTVQSDVPTNDNDISASNTVAVAGVAVEEKGKLESGVSIE